MLKSSIFSESTLYKNIDNYNYPLNLQYVGFLTNLSLNTPPSSSMWHFHRDRLTAISDYLKDFGVGLFIYSPADIDFKKNLATGYLLENKSFNKITIAPPKVNGDWVINFRIDFERRKKNYNDFLSWIKKYDIKLYSSFEFARLAGDKNQVAAIVKNIDGVNLPQSEVMDDIGRQLSEFIDKYPMVILKPKFGARAEKIIVIKKKSSCIEFRYYPVDFNFSNQEIVNECITHAEIENFVKKYTTDETYIIQQGIEVPRYNNAPTEFRVLMVNDGEKWNAFHVIYLGFSNTYISSQPHSDHNSIETLTGLTSMFGKVKAEEVLDKLLKLAFKITNYLSDMYPHQVPEMAYDFILDERQEIYFLEVNTKPALIAPTANLISPIFNILTEEKHSYDNYITPHGQSLGKFLHKRLLEFRNEYSNNQLKLILPNSKVFTK